MYRDNILKQILEASRDIWDCPATRPAVRENFLRILACGTPALGAEVYTSAAGTRVVYHTCKSRFCPSCGYRATLQWQLEKKADLPEIPYAGVVFTMPACLWGIFKENRHLLHDLPVLGAEVIQRWLKLKYGVRALILVVPHTFGGDLKFNTHLHILVSAAGLRESDNRWLSRIRFNKHALMRMWQYAVITHLRHALKANVLKSELNARDLRKMLTTEYERPYWIIDVDPLVSKSHFIGYAGRYVRRLPAPKRRLRKLTDHGVEFLAKDTREKRAIATRYSIEEFISRLAEHVPDRYRHSIRYFGMLAPRTKGQTWAGLFAILGQKRSGPPPLLRWRWLCITRFGVDPLIDSTGKLMSWSYRQRPIIA